MHVHDVMNDEKISALLQYYTRARSDYLCRPNVMMCSFVPDALVQARITASHNILIFSVFDSMNILSNVISFRIPIDFLSSGWRCEYM